MKAKYTLLVILIFIGMSGFAQRSDKKDGSALSVTGGVVYSLPRTGIRICVSATREKFFHGPYAQYAEALLGIKNAPSSDQENWTIDDIRIETFSEPDPEQVYKAHGSAAPLVSLTESGILAGINSFEETKEEVYPVSTFLGNTRTPEIPFTDLSLNPFFEKQDSAHANTIVVKSPEEKAREAAQTITKLRKRRFKTLANGYDEQLPDGQAYQVMVDELAKLEDEYVGLFVGKSFKKTFDYCFDFIPGDNSVSGEVVFRFSDTKGILPKTDMSGKPVVIDMKKLDDLASAQSKMTAGGAPGASSVFYRVPGKAEIRLLDGINLMAVTRAEIAQFGTVAALPDELLDGNYKISFHPTTGGIKSILPR